VFLKLAGMSLAPEADVTPFDTGDCPSMEALEVAEDPAGVWCDFTCQCGEFGAVKLVMDRLPVIDAPDHKLTLTINGREPGSAIAALREARK
jgi:hypothetical protein